jgi:hypothetical protein
MRNAVHWLAAGLLAAFLAPAALPADVFSAQAELDRVKALINAGALPQRALRDAERALEQARFEQSLRKTQRASEVTMSDLAELRTALERLRALTRDEADRNRALFEADVLPLQQYRLSEERAELAEKQYQLAEERAKIVRDLTEMAAAEKRLNELLEDDLAYESEGYSAFWEDDLLALDGAFHQMFGQPLPVSADGATELHRSLGFDHAGRVDIAVDPNSEEGMFVMAVLESWGIPYIAFRAAAPGVSTGPHIHVGTRSDRIAPGEPAGPAGPPQEP